MINKLDLYFEQYLNKFQPYKGFWCYEDGLILKGALDLYNATQEEKYLSFVKSYLNEFVDGNGSLKGYTSNEYNIDHVNAGKVLFQMFEMTGEEKYRVGIEHLMNQLRTHPRTKTGNFWHKKRYPNQVWLDGLYMALPFFTEYETKYNGKQNYEDIFNQFHQCYQLLKDEETGLYYHAFDESKTMFWCNEETGRSANVWLRAEGWYIMALIDTIDVMSETIFEYYKGLIDIFKVTLDDLIKYQDEKTGMWYQVVNHSGRENNYLEVSGTAMIIYSILKGIRLNILDEKYRNLATKALSSMLDIYGYEEAEQLHIGGICKVAGLGSFEGVVRDGSFDYYISEEVVADEAKGIGPLMMAYAELKLGD